MQAIKKCAMKLDSDTPTLPKGFQLEEFAPPAKVVLPESILSLLQGVTVSCSTNATERCAQLEGVLQRLATKLYLRNLELQDASLDESVMKLLEKAHSLREWRLSFDTSTTSESATSIAAAFSGHKD